MFKWSVVTEKLFDPKRLKVGKYFAAVNKHDSWIIFIIEEVGDLSLKAVSIKDKKSFMFHIRHYVDKNGLSNIVYACENSEYDVAYNKEILKHYINNLNAAISLVDREYNNQEK